MNFKIGEKIDVILERFHKKEIDLLSVRSELIILFNNEFQQHTQEKELSPQPVEDTPESATEAVFCKVYNGLYGENIDSIYQMKIDTFDGLELLNLCKAYADQLKGSGLK